MANGLLVRKLHSSNTRFAQTPGTLGFRYGTVPASPSETHDGANVRCMAGLELKLLVLADHMRLVHVC